MRWSQLSRVTVSILSISKTEALLTRQVIGPNSRPIFGSKAFYFRFFGEVGLRAPCCGGRADGSPPRVALGLSPRLVAMDRDIPAGSASFRAMARPRRLAPPVTKAMRAVLMASELLGAEDFDAEAGEAHILPLFGRKDADRLDAEILEDLRAEAHFAPLFQARRLAAGCGGGGRRHADGTFPQIDDDAAPGLLDLRQGAHDAAVLGIEDVRHGVFLLQADDDVAAVADIPVDDGDMMRSIEGGGIDHGARRPIAVADRRLPRSRVISDSRCWR